MNNKNSITIDHLRTMPIGQIAALDPAQLARLQAEAIEAVSAAKLTKDLLDGVLGHKYSDQAMELRHQKGKDFGTVRFDDGDVTVISDLPKKPVWDQKLLSDIVQKIQEAGDDASEYVETAFKISESKFTAWPKHIRHIFEPARTLKTGKSGFKLSPKKMGECS